MKSRSSSEQYLPGFDYQNTSSTLSSLSPEIYLLQQASKMDGELRSMFHSCPIGAPGSSIKSKMLDLMQNT
jgi:hypothetical protein